VTTKSTSKDLLNEKIKQLELKQANQAMKIKRSYTDLLESLQPANIVGSALKNVIATPGLKSTFIDTIISAGAGILGKKIVAKKSGNIFRKIAGLATQFLVTNMVRNKIPDLKNKKNGASVIDEE